ncbi:MAG: hypothetical protein JWN30_6 [Bacilli bacterium]|nr:hypothetical protein [Bacilli bacterium]
MVMNVETNEPGRFENGLWRVTVFSFVILLGVQGLDLVPQFRSKLIAPAAAVGAGQSTSAAKSVTQVTIRLVGSSALPAPAKVCVNGVQVGNFTGTSCTVAVSANDVVTVDTSQSPGIYEFTIDEDNSRVVSPTSGETFDASIYHAATIGPFLLDLS